MSIKFKKLYKVRQEIRTMQTDDDTAILLITQDRPSINKKQLQEAYIKAYILNYNIETFDEFAAAACLRILLYCIESRLNLIVTGNNVVAEYTAQVLSEIAGCNIDIPFIAKVPNTFDKVFYEAAYDTDYWSHAIVGV